MPSTAPRGIRPTRRLSQYSRSWASFRRSGHASRSHCFISGGVFGSAISPAAAMRVSWTCSLLLQARAGDEATSAPRQNSVRIDRWGMRRAILTDRRGGASAATTTEHRRAQNAGEGERGGGGFGDGGGFGEGVGDDDVVDEDVALGGVAAAQGDAGDAQRGARGVGIAGDRGRGVVAGGVDPELRVAGGEVVGDDDAVLGAGVEVRREGGRDAAGGRE